MIRKSSIETYICQKMIEYLEIQPFSKVKVTEFTKFAEISRSSFYTYFDSLSDVIQKIEDDFINSLDDEHTLSIKEIQNSNNKKFILALQFIYKNLDTYRILSSENGDPYFQIRLANRSAKILENFFKQVPTDLSTTQVKLLIENISGGRWQMYRWWSNHPDEVTLEEVADLTKEMIKSLFEIIKK